MRVAAIVTSDGKQLREALERCRAAAAEGAAVRVFFRDESIPSLCPPSVWERLALVGVVDVSIELAALKGAGDVTLHACSSSLYLWGIAPDDLLPSIDGVRGLIAFLADDLTGADEVLS